MELFVKAGRMATILGASFEVPGSTLKSGVGLRVGTSGVDEVPGLELSRGAFSIGGVSPGPVSGVEGMSLVWVGSGRATICIPVVYTLIWSAAGLRPVNTQSQGIFEKLGFVKIC